MITLLCFGGGERSVELPTPPSAKKKRLHVDPFTVQQLLASVGSARPLLLWAHAGPGDSGPRAPLEEDTALVAGGTYYITYKTISVYVADAEERGTVISVELCSLFAGPAGGFASQPQASQFVLALQHKLCDAVHARFSAWSHFQWWARLDPAERGRVEITDHTAAAWSCFLSPLDGPAQPQLFVAPSTATNRYSESDAAQLRDGEQLSPAWRVARAACFFTASQARCIKDKPAFAAKFCCFTADTQPSSAFAKANLDHGRELENFVRVAALAALRARRVSFDAYRAGMCFSIW